MPRCDKSLVRRILQKESLHEPGGVGSFGQGKFLETRDLKFELRSSRQGGALAKDQQRERGQQI